MIVNKKNLPEKYKVQYLMPALSSNLLLNSFVNDIFDLNSFEMDLFNLNYKEFNFKELFF